MILAAEECGCPIEVEGASLENSPICGGTILFMTLLQGFLWGRCDIAQPCKRIVSVSSVDEEYDFIVVGAGSAGSIVAGRLTENDKFSVLLLEAGGPEPIGSKVPAFYRTFWSNQEVDWDYYTQPGDYCLNNGDKGCSWPRGKVLGGTSVLNGMMYHRGHPADYEDWVAAGATGWSWDDNRKYFDMTEGNREIGSVVSEKYHSDSGPLPVQRFNHQPAALYALMDAINETGLPLITDMNDPTTPAGFNIAQTFNLDGQRYTTARAYLLPKSERPTLSVRLHALATKVVFEGKRAVAVQFLDENTGESYTVRARKEVVFEGKRAVAVQFLDENTAESYTVRARKEVILSAGALNSPHLLLLSGVGPKETLAQHDIPLVEDLPVGHNLLNHIGVTLNFILSAVNDTFVLDWANTAEYLLTRQGPLSSTGLTQLTGLEYSSIADRSREQPDMQFFFNGFYAECSTNGQPGEPAQDCPENGMNVSANAVNLLPKSVGRMTLRSNDPLDAPIFDANYFEVETDMLVVKEGIRLLRKIFDSPSLQEKYEIKLDPAYTGRCDEKTEQWSDSWLECIIRLNTDPQNHQLGTAAIGRVLDTNLKVYNLEGIRVIDASSIPTLVTGNPQGPIMMVAERGAAFIREEYQ